MSCRHDIQSGIGRGKSGIKPLDEIKGFFKSEVDSDKEPFYHCHPSTKCLRGVLHMGHMLKQHDSRYF